MFTPHRSLPGCRNQSQVGREAAHSPSLCTKFPGQHRWQPHSRAAGKSSFITGPPHLLFTPADTASMSARFKGSPHMHQLPHRYVLDTRVKWKYESKRHKHRKSMNEHAFSWQFKNHLHGWWCMDHDYISFKFWRIAVLRLLFNTACFIPASHQSTVPDGNGDRGSWVGTQAQDLSSRNLCAKERKFRFKSLLTDNFGGWRRNALILE